MATQMTPRQRLLAVMEGRHPDRIPWSPRLELWYEAHQRWGTLPEKYQGWDLKDIYLDMEMCVQARDLKWQGVYRTELRDVDVHRHENALETRTEYVTPVGTVSTLERRSEKLASVGIQGLIVEHLIKGPDDYAPVEYMVEHTEIIPTYSEYLAYEQEIGEDGIPVVGVDTDPMAHILEDLVGYNNAFFHFCASTL